MNRGDFQKLARLRLKEAQMLLQSGFADGAFYLAGYSLECALKACYAKRTKRFDFPAEPNEHKIAYSHDLERLAKIAGVHEELQRGDTRVASNWAFVVAQWSHSSRYRFVKPQEAQDLIEAISDRKHGVLMCIQKHW